MTRRSGDRGRRGRAATAKSLSAVGYGMGDQTQDDAERSSVGRLLALALTFAIGYALGSRSAGPVEPRDRTEREPTEITIDGDDAGEAAGDEGENGIGGNKAGENETGE